jgi:hypothetical protein
VPLLWIAFFAFDHQKMDITSLPPPTLFPCRLYDRSGYLVRVYVLFIKDYKLQKISPLSGRKSTRLVLLNYVNKLLFLRFSVQSSLATRRANHSTLILLYRFVLIKLARGYLLQLPSRPSFHLFSL